ncbi:KinB-signaling pathway activation protein [Cytobacillus purgationiresistens]|uniref:KinB signaling pathway activation protein n=1 Tax=Cytobacillus purgationiresistens TaxID=863449 RepID=A0ABU0AMX8_9BACI|nr:KinB-signaling pathway activation protein [Cytobacillus purgationiresistens]MDQ0272624.1 KinB signaling pathway activation protein [Cytobacillus purgationiresistens]
MTSRVWVKFFLTTLLVGGITTGIVGFIVRWDEFEHLFVNFEWLEILSVLFWLIGVGLIFSIISQMGFFAYLTIHRFGLGIFKSHKLWNGVQVILILFVLFDLVYFRYKGFADSGDSMLPYFGLAAVILIVGLIVAFMKVKTTNKVSFIPALFFMIVATTIEWVPVLRVNEESWIWLMVFPLLVCNAYQLLILPKLNKESAAQRVRLQANKSSN